MAENEKLVMVEKAGVHNNIAIIILNRQKALNSFNNPMLNELEQVFHSMKKDPELRAVILTAEGKSWCGGADLKWMSTLDDKNYEQLIKCGQDVFEIIETFPCPIIAAINGFTLGGGMELALCCDIRIASENAVLGQPEVTLGLSPGWGGTYRLQKIAGVGVAKDLILTGRKISAKEALRMNILNEICPQEKLKEKAMEWAEIIARNAPLAIIEAKKAINDSRDGTIKEGYVNEVQGARRCFASQDLKEGISAIFEKRNPTFKGK